MKGILVLFGLFELIGVIILPRLSHAQNLVLNPGFEDSISCPGGMGYIGMSNGWTSYMYGTPDYFHICAPNCSFPSTCVGIPRNFAGYQQAYDGNAYAGIITYHNSIPSARELIGTELSSTLQIGKKYFVSAYFCRGNDFSVRSASNSIGFRFSTIPYSDLSPCPIDNFSHVSTLSILTDSVNWTKISGVFIADDAYKYLIIGNFCDDLHTDTADMYIDSQYSHAYYYVDNVCVSEDSLCQATTNISSTEIVNRAQAFPSPFNSELTVTCSDNELLELAIYDCTMKNMIKQRFSNTVILNTNGYNRGIYFYVISNKFGILHKGMVIHE